MVSVPTTPPQRSAPMLHVLTSSTGRKDPCFLQHEEEDLSSPPVLSFADDRLSAIFFAPSGQTEDEDVATPDDEAQDAAELALQNVDLCFARLAAERKAKWSVARGLDHAEQQLDRLEQRVCEI